MNTSPCWLKQFSKLDCGPSTHYPSATTAELGSCLKKTNSHLRRLQASSQHIDCEWKLILARCGVFHFDYEAFKGKKVCPLHREQLGLYWKDTRTCKHPSHGNSKEKHDRGVNFQVSKQILDELNILVPVGSGICRKCRQENAARSTKQTDLVRLEIVQEDSGQSEQELEGDESFLNDTDISLARDENQQFDVDWCPTPRSNDNLSSINKFLLASGRSVSPVRSQLRVSFDEASASTTRYYKRKAKEVVLSALDSIAPGQGDRLLQTLRFENESGTGPSVLSSQENLKYLATLYDNAQSWYVRQQILSTFADDYSKTNLLKFIPGLTVYRIDQARKHAKEYGVGVQMEVAPITRCRMDKTKIDHFLDFISSPSYHQDVAYGTKKVVISSTETIEIPNMIRTVIASRIIEQYRSFCEETGFNEPLASSTLFAVLKVFKNIRI